MSGDGELSRRISVAHYIILKSVYDSFGKFFNTSITYKFRILVVFADSSDGGFACCIVSIR